MRTAPDRVLQVDPGHGPGRTSANSPNGVYGSALGTAGAAPYRCINASLAPSASPAPILRVRRRASGWTERSQFGLQFTTVRFRPGRTDYGCWSRLNRSERPRPELLIWRTVQQRPHTAASEHDQQHTELAGTATKRP